jgi:FMN phosphatase YigB (HAD superfamily)
MFTWPNARISVMGGEQAASVLATVHRDADKWDEREAESFKAPIRQKYEDEGTPYYATSRLWDDGLIDPAQTRDVLGLAERIAPQTTLALFTNNGQWLGRQLPKFFPELRPLFGTRMITTGQLGLTKPDPQAFYACLSTLGYSPASALMIDDRTENVSGALSAGLDAIHYTSPPQLAGELLRRGFDLEPAHAP